MKIRQIKISGIRSYNESEVNIDDYLVLVGENNTGKSNFLFALQCFFGKRKLTTEDIKIKYNENPTIEISFEVNKEEEWFDHTKKGENLIKIKAVFDNNNPKPSGLKVNYFYEDGTEFKNPKFPIELQLVPAYSNLDEECKTTSDNSTIMKLLNKLVINRLEKEEGKNSQVSKLRNQITELSNYMNQGEDGALNSLKKNIQEYLLDYPDVDFQFTLKPPETKELVKKCFYNNILLEGNELRFSSQGMGFQRSMIYALLSALADIEENSENTLFLIEEPEIYLHPNHQQNFRNKLLKLSSSTKNQVIVTTHSPYFVSNVEDYENIARTEKANHNSIINQISNEEVKKICNNNGELMAKAKKICQPNSDEKKEAKSIAEEDEIRYLLWMDPRRANAFLSKKVLLVEGSTEVALCSYVLENKKGELYEMKGKENLSVIDIVGKFHIYKFACLLRKLGIKVWCVYDDDDNNKKHGIDHELINKGIENLKSDNTIEETYITRGHIENHLGFQKENITPGIKLYKKLSKNENNIKEQDPYKEIVRFIKNIIEK